MSTVMVDSLETKCIETFVDNLDYCLTQLEDDLNLKAIVQRTFGKTITSLILSHSKPVQNMKPEHVQFILNPFTKDLVMDCSVFKVPKLVIKRLKIIGEVIETVILTFSGSSWRMKDIVTCVSLMTNLWKITINIERDIKSLRSLLKKIAKKCPRVRVLSIASDRSSSKKDNFLDLRLLCPMESDGSIGKNYVIEELHIIDFINKEKTDFALHHFPNLTDLPYFNLGNVLQEILQQELKHDLLSVFKLKRLAYYCFPDNKSIPALESLYKICPHIESLTLDVGIVRPQLQRIVDSLVNYRCLKELYFSMFSSRMTYEFDGEQSPFIDLTAFLQKRGSGLVELHVQGCVNFATLRPLCRYCPNLRKLFMACNSFQSIESSSESYLLPCLEEVEILAMDLDSPSTVQELGLLFSCCPDVKSLTLIDCVPMKKTVVAQMANTLCFRHVKHLALRSCKISVEDLKVLIANAYDLQHLYVTCDDYTDAECAVLEDMCAKQNYLLTLEQYK